MIKYLLNKKAAFIVAFVFLTSCNPKPAQLELGGATMGTTWSAKLVLTKDKNVDQFALQAQLEKVLTDFNQVASTWITDSEISRFNQYQSTQPFTVSKELGGLVVASKLVNQASQGYFEVTVSPLIELWGFGKTFSEDKVPDAKDIANAKAKIGSEYINVILNHSSETASLNKTKPELAINLSAIAKGRGVDLLSQVLENFGISNYMVEIGGEIKASGLNKKNKPWQIAIEKPMAGQRSVQKIVGLDNIAIATSGDYRNFFDIDGQRYSHSINPNTGWPVKHGLVSVTVLHEQAMLADAWATALIVAGPEQAIKLADTNNLPVLLIFKNKDGFKEQANALFAAKIQVTN